MRQLRKEFSDRCQDEVFHSYIHVTKRQTNLARNDKGDKRGKKSNIVLTF